MSRVRLFLAVGLHLSLAGCAEDPATAPESLTPPAIDEIDEISQSVIGGSAALPCQWPSTVRVESGGYCTGTLIHPRVVTTAAHCLQGNAATIGFGEVGAAGTFSVKARCVAGANGSSGANTAKDWGYCILPADPRVDAIPVTPPLVGCEAKLVAAGAKAWVVGYGATSARGNVMPKRQVEVVVNALNKIAPGTLDVGDKSAGACHGDSGGPLYVHLTKDGHDYGVRVAGSTSGAGSALFCDCTCSTTYIAIENHVRAIEKNEGIDVTPCTDADGSWNPGPLCRDFQSTPEKGTGTYPAACMVQKTSGPIESCGSNALSADAGAGDGGASAGAGGDAGSSADPGHADAGTGSASANADAATKPAAPADAGRARADAAAPVVTGSTRARDAGKADAASSKGGHASDDSSDDSSDDGYTKASSSCAVAGAGASNLGELLVLCLGGLGLFARRRRLTPR